MSRFRRKQEQLFAILAEVCRSGDVAKLTSLLDSDSGILDIKDSAGRTLLHYCCEHDHTETAELILSKRPDLLTLQDDDGYTVLHLAAISGNSSLVRFIIGEGKRLLPPESFKGLLDCFDNENHTALHWATVSGEVECLILLHKSGADLNLPDVHGAHPIHYASQSDTSKSKNKKSLQILKEILLFANSEKDCKDKDGRTPLIWAASSGNYEGIMALLTAGADATQQDKDGLTALHCAASRGHLDCIETLLTFGGAPVDQMDCNGCTPLFYAITLGHADCTRLLLQQGAQANHQDRKGRSGAHCGSAKGQLETIKLLAQGGGNLWLRNIRGDLPIHEAIKSGRREVVLFLMEMRPPDIDLCNTIGKSPLHVACIANDIEMCKILIDYGADLNPVMKQKGMLMTPLDICLQKGFRSCAKFLLLHGALPASKLSDPRRLPLRKLDMGDSHSNSCDCSPALDYPHRDSYGQMVPSQSESSHSFAEVRLPSRMNPLKAAPSRISQRVQVFTDVPGTPCTCVSTTTDSETRPHTMITNVYVTSQPTITTKKKVLKKIKRKARTRLTGMQTPGPQAVHNGVDIWRPETDDSGSFQSEHLPKGDDENTYLVNSEIVESSEKLVAASTKEALEEIAAQSYSTDNSEDHFNHEAGGEYEDALGEGGVEEEEEGAEESQVEEEGEEEAEISDAERKEICKNETESNEETSIQEKVITSGAAEMLIESIEKHVTSDLPGKEERENAELASQSNIENEGEASKVKERQVKAQDEPVNGTRVDDNPRDELKAEGEKEKEQSHEEPLSHEKCKPMSERKDSLEKYESTESKTEKQSSEKIEEVDVSSNNRRKRSLGEPEINKETVDEEANVEREIQSNYVADEKSDINCSKMQRTEEKADLQTSERAGDLLALPPMASLEAKSRKVAPLAEEESPSATDKIDLNNNENSEDNREAGKTKGEREEDTGEEADVCHEEDEEDRDDATGEKRGSIGSRKKWDRRGSLHPALPKIHKVDFGDAANSVDGSEESSPCASVIANDKMTDREELVISLKSGEKIRATTMIEVEGQEIDSVEYTKSATKSGRRKSKSLSKCNHRLHRKQSLTNVKPLDLKHVKAKVDSRPPDVFLRKSPAAMSDLSGRSFHRSPLTAHKMSHMAHDITLSSKKYAAERKIFEELQELKRCQMRANRAHESILVRRLSDRFNSQIVYPGLGYYSGEFDFKSYERFLYDQLRQISSSNREKLRASSEDNLTNTELDEGLLGHKSFSAEILMSRPNEYIHSNEYCYSRFIDLSERKGAAKDGDKGRAFAVPILCEGKFANEPKSYRRVLSDVVKIENSLDYGIITRSGSRMSDQGNTVTHRVKATLHQSTGGDGATVAATVPPLGPPRGKGQSKQFASVDKSNSRSNPTRTTAKCEQVKSLNPPQRRNCVKALLQDGERRARAAGPGPSASRLQVRRHKSHIPPPTRIQISEDQIAQRWQGIKQQERRRRKSDGETAVTYLYEVNTGRRLSTQSLSAHNSNCCGPRPVSRTLSDSDMQSGRFGCC